MLPLWIWVPSIFGEYRWAILSAFPKPMPVRHNTAVFPKFFTTNKTLGLPYLPFDPIWAPLGEKRSLRERGSLCFQIYELGNCIRLTSRALGMFFKYRGGVVKITQDTSNRDITLTNRTFWHEATWVNGTFLPPNFSDKERPNQPKMAPHCSLEDEGLILPWSDCQSSITRWADQSKTFSFSPNMIDDPEQKYVMKKGLFIQDFRMHPFHKWVLCGINGSCTDLNPLVFLQGGAAGKTIFNGISKFAQFHQVLLPDRTIYQNSTTEITGFNKTLIKQTNYLPTPVCVYTPFLFILSNGSFESCTNETCWMSQCWSLKWASRAMLAKIPRWVPVPLEIPSTITLHRQKRDFGITAAVVVAMAASAAAATAAGIAMATSVQSSTTVEQLSSSVAEAIDQHSVLSAQLKGGLMIVNQRIDLVEERLEILLQLAQLGCDKKSGALCITSVQYENWTHAANLSKELSLFLTGNWSEGFDEKLEALRTAVMTINSTRVDPSLIDGIKGLSSWMSSAFSHFKEWVGVGLFGATLCCGLVFLLWLVCKLRSQQKRDKVVIAQALAAIEQGTSPEIWLSILKN